VGDDSLKSLADSQTQIDDLHGATVIPGLVDATSALGLDRARSARDRFVYVPTKEEALRRLLTRQSTPIGEWLSGQGWAQRCGRWCIPIWR